MSIEDDIKIALAAEGIDASEAVQKAQVTESKPSKKEKISEVKEEKSSEQEYTDFEQEQIADGWNPKGPKTAEEWATDGPVYKELHKRNQEVKKMQKALDALNAHNAKVEQVAYNKALETLRQEKEQAIKQGDVRAVNQIEKQYEELTKPKEVIPEAETFKEKYGHILQSSNFEEMEISAFILNRDKELMAKGLSPAEHMKTLEDHMLKKFSNYFNIGKKVVGRSSRTEVEMGEGSNVARVSTGKKKYSINDLDDTQKKVWGDMKRYTKMSVEDYISDLVKSGDLN